MKNYKKHIDDFFREKLGNYAETPPADVWDNLDVRLDSLKPVVPGGATSYKWLWHMGMVSLITVLSVSITRKLIGTKADSANIASEQPAMEPVASATAPDAAPTPVTEATATKQSTDAAEGGTNATEATGPTTATTPGKIHGATAQVEHNKDNAVQGRKAIAVTGSHLRDINKAGTSALYASAAHTGPSAKTQPADVYNSSNNIAATSSFEPSQKVTDPKEQFTANTNSAVPQAAKADVAVAEKMKTTLPAATKPKTTDKAPVQQKVRPSFNKWEAGIKGGYEGGFNNDAANKIVIAPYLQYNLSPKVAIMVHPAVKFAKSNTRSIGAGQSYTQVNNDGQVQQVGNTDTRETLEGTTIVTRYVTRFNYSQTHDSVVKTNTYGGAYVEYELPVLVKYKISPRSSVYGGVNVIYSQSKGVTEHTFTKAGIRTSIDTLLTTSAPSPTPPALNDVIKNDGTPYSNYNGPLYPTTSQNQVRLGAMVGFSYEYSKRLLFDALIQQNPGKTEMKGGYNINASRSATYFRVSVGYKLTK